MKKIDPCIPIPYMYTTIHTAYMHQLTIHNRTCTKNTHKSTRFLFSSLAFHIRKSKQPTHRPTDHHQRRRTGSFSEKTADSHSFTSSFSYLFTTTDVMTLVLFNKQENFFFLSIIGGGGAVVWFKSM